jgi:glycerophosphoryl diester phosphodiesterase
MNLPYIFYLNPMKTLLPVMLLLAVSANAQNTFDIQGHRGCRGLMPENTIPAFLKAIDLGVNTIELDVVVTADNQILVSHEPWMNPDIATYPDGKPVLEGDKDKTNIYHLTNAEVQKYDVGSRGNPKFAEQQKMKVSKPLLSEVIDAVEKYIAEKKLPAVKYNIEIKCHSMADETYHPLPEKFADMVVALIKSKNIEGRYNIQSFDSRTLIYIHKTNPEIPLAYLVANLKSLKGNIKKLGFTPHTFSPYYALLNKKMIAQAHKMGMKVIPWTVNDADKMKELKDEGVDGVITDYPDRAIKALR